MLPIIVIGTLGVAAATLTKYKLNMRKSKETILQINLQKLNKQLYYLQLAKTILVIGQPGSGKSSLIKHLANGRIYPNVVIGQHTDATDWSNSEIGNFVFRFKNIHFIDMPGYGTQMHDTEEILNGIEFKYFKKIIFVIKGKINAHDQVVFSKLMQYNPIIVRTFSEGLNESELKSVTEDIGKNLNKFIKVSFVSNRTNMNLEILKNRLEID